MSQGESAGLNDFKEIAYRKFSIVGRTIKPDVPDKKGIDGFRKLAQITFNVEDDMVVQRHRYAHIVQRCSKALHVLDGVSIGVKHVRVRQNSP